ncbi:NAD(P)H-dependent flavin oxidoreductase [Acidicapsa dinghuensis]|uniref:Propionate 3-nitronate monooxygenase n=1 Tax=Acidicapsa dinghuensis TaxID=2218256 RepID=A0ABW1EGQ1_9BACT|nr:nitronate monooxygenase [Acidicapsa dinghuensis]
MPHDSRLAGLLGIELPILQAPMAGGPSTPKLAASVSNAGGMGSLAGGMSSPDRIREEIAATRRLTERPFAMNLFVLETPHPAPEVVEHAVKLLQPLRDELGLPPQPPITKFCESFDEQFEALLESEPAVASFTFGILSESQVEALHRRRILVSGTATTVAEARAWQAVGADMVCAQGADAGAHRGTFLDSYENSLIGTMALIPLVCDAVKIPVIAAGGIMDGRGIAAARMLGAFGVQMGTAFMLCPEAGTSQLWRDALRNGAEHPTRVSRVYSGRAARGLVNEFMLRLSPHEHEIAPYPIQNALSGPIRRAAAQANRPEFLSLWAGQGVGLCREVPAGELVRILARETQEMLET